MSSRLENLEREWIERLRAQGVDVNGTAEEQASAKALLKYRPPRPPRSAEKALADAARALKRAREKGLA